MRHVALHCVAPLLALALVACDAGTSASGIQSPAVRPAAVADASPRLPTSTQRPTPPAIDPLAGLDCAPARSGSARSCSTPSYDVSGTHDACTPDSASFGAVQPDGPVIAHDRLGEGARPVATLAPGQFVCIQYNADPVGGDGEGWVYVTAISPSSVPICSDATCGDAAAASRWNDGRSQPCDIEDGVYSPGCPAGWVSLSRIDAYSMGLNGQYAEH